MTYAVSLLGTPRTGNEDASSDLQDFDPFNTLSRDFALALGFPCHLLVTTVKSDGFKLAAYSDQEVVAA